MESPSNSAKCRKLLLRRKNVQNVENLWRHNFLRFLCSVTTFTTLHQTFNVSSSLNCWTERKKVHILINPFLAFLGIWGMISWDQRRSGVDNQRLRGELFLWFCLFCMLTFPMMVIKLSLQVDFFVLRPKIETKRYNVVHVFIVVAVLPCWFFVSCGFLFGFWRKYTWKMTL